MYKRQTRDLEIPAATEIFDQKKIEKLGANNVMEVVRNIPGFTLTASPTGKTYVGFRGVSKDNVAILVNGIPLNQDGNYDLESCFLYTSPHLKYFIILHHFTHVVYYKLFTAASQ